ncbi:hypothetical protein ACUXAV_000797 [Cupriavidus metallidurans]|jgi:hypothetical protein|uniref:hypothetical protein n=1 Tax=Cupriavidus TaxID=106589 RepID=UPI0004931093|nr:hypothetical protein [Cupriavidus metallidurans]KWW37562.1 hypothetical protein AU374_01327 [Cupriavidus metallidurans]MDE4918698.1 hypothetical protein [Cupriavidus metallidurans]
MNLLPGADPKRTPRPYHLTMAISAAIADAIEAERTRVADLSGGIKPSVSAVAAAALERALRK